MKGLKKMNPILPGRHSRVWVPVALLGVSLCLMLPFAIQQTVADEWTTSLYLIEAMRREFLAGRFDLYFVHTLVGGEFYPFYVFYGGALFTVLGSLALILGSWPVFLASVWAGFALVMTGGFLMARALGVGRWGSLALGGLLVVAPYTVSILYGRGGWAELLGVGFGACALGLAARLTSRPRAHLSAEVPLLALAVAGLAGTHNISLLLMATVGGCVLLVLLPSLVARAPRRVGLANLGWVVGAGARGVAMVGYWLIPNLWLGLRTRLGGTGINTLAGFSDLTTVFAPWLRFTEAQASVTVAQLYGLAAPIRIYIQTETLLLVPIFVGILLALRRRVPWRWWVTTAGLAVMTLCLTLLIDRESLFWSLPEVFGRIQFTFRLVSYLTLVLVLLTSLVLLVGGRLVGALVVACLVWYTVLAAAQPLVIGGTSPQYSAPWDVSSGQPAPPFAAAGDVFLPQVVKPVTTWASSPAPLVVDATGRVAELPPPGEYLTTVACSPLVAVVNGSLLSGASDTGRCVVAIRPASGVQVIAPAWPLPRVAGLALTGVGVIGWLMLTVMTVATGRRESVGGPPHRITA